MATTYEIIIDVPVLAGTTEEEALSAVRRIEELTTDLRAKHSAPIFITRVDEHGRVDITNRILGS